MESPLSILGLSGSPTSHTDSGRFLPTAAHMCSHVNLIAQSLPSQIRAMSIVQPV